jgi:hypothetical protein
MVVESREAACVALGGVLQSNTCIVERDASPSTSDCRRACATRVYADELGACYEWQRTADGGTRAVHQMSDACWAKYPRFDALCDGVRTLPGAAGGRVDMRSLRRVPTATAANVVSMCTACHDT